MTMIVVKTSEDLDTILLTIPASSDAHRLMGRFEAARRLDDKGGYALPADQADTFIRHARTNGWHLYDQRLRDHSTPTSDPVGQVLIGAGRPPNPDQAEINRRGAALVQAVRNAYRDATITEAMCECGHLADHHQYRDVDGTVLVALPDQTRGTICQHLDPRDEAADCPCATVRHADAYEDHR